MMKSHPRKPPRFNQNNAAYFLTFCTFKRRQFLNFPGIPEFLNEELRFYERNVKKLVAYTIMPDHMHLIIEVEDAKSLTVFLRNFKSYTSKEIKKRIDCSRCPQDVATNILDRGNGNLLTDRRIVSSVDRIWQPGTMDHCIRMSWNGRDYENHLCYLFYNSWKHLGIAPKDFQYHNFCEFVDRGVFDIDFCAIDDPIIEACRKYE